jgi:uncharacterized protein (TIGR02598 family)
MIATMKQSAFSLVEVTLALGIAAFCLIAIVGLLPIGMTSNQTATEQTASVGILSGIAADLRATPRTSPPGGAATSVQYALAIPASPNGASTQTLFFAEDGTFSAAMGATSRYRVVVSFAPNTAARSATMATLKATWPAVVDPTSGNPAGSATMFVALDRN